MTLREALINTKVTKRTIHFYNSDYLPFVSDKDFMAILNTTMQSCGHTLNIFSSGIKDKNNELKKLVTKQKAWIKQALNDPLLNQSEKDFIKRINSKFVFKKDSQLWSNLAADLKPAFDYLVKFQTTNNLLKGRRDTGKTTARYFLLEALSKWNPHNSELCFDEDTDFMSEERLKKHLF